MTSMNFRQPSLIQQMCNSHFSFLFFFFHLIILIFFHQIFGSRRQRFTLAVSSLLLLLLLLLPLLLSLPSPLLLFLLLLLHTSESPSLTTRSTASPQLQRTSDDSSIENGRNSLQFHPSTNGSPKKLIPIRNRKKKFSSTSYSKSTDMPFAVGTDSSGELLKRIHGEGGEIPAERRKLPEDLDLPLESIQ